MSNQQQRNAYPGDMADEEWAFGERGYTGKGAARAAAGRGIQL